MMFELRSGQKQKIPEANSERKKNVFLFFMMGGLFFNPEMDLLPLHRYISSLPNCGAPPTLSSLSWLISDDFDF
jgi:hypothetical protein